MSWVLVKETDRSRGFYVHEATGTRADRISTILRYDGAASFEYHHKKKSMEYHNTVGARIMKVGNELHQIFAAYFSGSVFNYLPKEYIEPLNNMIRIKHFYGVEPILVEKTFGDLENKWAGTVDLVANITKNCTPGLYLIDHKTGSFSKSMWLQLAAYHNFYCNESGIDPKTVGVALFIVHRLGNAFDVKFMSGEEILKKYKSFWHLGQFFNREKMRKKVKEKKGIPNGDNKS